MRFSGAASGEQRRARAGGRVRCARRAARAAVLAYVKAKVGVCRACSMPQRLVSMAMTWKTVWKASAMRPRLPAATPYADCASASADSAPTKVSSERDSRPDSAASKSAEARADAQHVAPHDARLRS